MNHEMKGLLLPLSERAPDKVSKWGRATHVQQHVYEIYLFKAIPPLDAFPRNV